MNEADQMLVGGKIPSAAFDKHGDTITGVIESYERSQQRDFATGEPKTWATGEPMYQVVFTLQTTLRDATVEDDDGRRKVYAKFKMMEAIQGAIARAQLKPPFDGCVLTVTYTGDDKPARKGVQGAKLYTAEIEQSDYDPGSEPF